MFYIVSAFLKQCFDHSKYEDDCLRAANTNSATTQLTEKERHREAEAVRHCRCSQVEGVLRSVLEHCRLVGWLENQETPQTSLLGGHELFIPIL